MGLRLDLDEPVHTHGRKTVAVSMKGQGPAAGPADKYKAATDSGHDRPVFPNLLQQT